ncbi:unnamed protein product, partial [marine sediment metagenome]
MELFVFYPGPVFRNDMSVPIFDSHFLKVAQMSVDNPFGMKPDDPAGRDDVLIANPELHLPVNQPYKFVLRSKDVLHNFTVPQFRVKMDLVPGMTPYAWLKPTLVGRYDIMCEELCGVAHFAMRGAVVVEEEDAFNDWLDSYPTYAEVLALPAPNVAAGQTAYAVCSACHGPGGGGQCIAQCAQTDRVAGLVPEAANNEFQARSSRCRRPGR